MKFVFADSMDQIDPSYDFLSDSHTAGRRPYWDDLYPHEVFQKPPYDGILVSRGIVGDSGMKGKYSISQAMRFQRIGAREFLRYPEEKFPGSIVFGDNGAFTYLKEEVPPMSVDQTLEFYADGKFTHGCSTDHVILNFNDDLLSDQPPTTDAQNRFEITLQNANEFIKKSCSLGSGFTPVGVVQGWSPSSMASAAQSLISMGYRYLAVGGLVPLKVDQIHKVLTSITNAIGTKVDTKLHLLGFAKADHVREFRKYPIASFDSTSPLIRAFKDASRNYYWNGENGLKYFSAIRIPQALENPKLKRAVKSGRASLEQITTAEKSALTAVRNFAKGKGKEISVAEEVAEYNRYLLLELDKEAQEQRIEKMTKNITETLQYRAWEKCKCEICKSSGVEVMIFRASNRNKRRGFHNLHIYRNNLSSIQ